MEKSSSWAETPSSSGLRKRSRIWFTPKVRKRDTTWSRMRKVAPLAEAERMELDMFVNGPAFVYRLSIQAVLERSSSHGVLWVSLVVKC